MPVRAITNFPSREVVQRAYELHDLGWGTPRIANELGVSRHAVWQWISRPERFDPYIDEVAVERALEGDRSVYERLTIYELHEFLDRIEARTLLEPYDRLLHYPRIDEPSSRGGTRIPYWLHELESMLGCRRGELSRILHDRVVARKRRAAAA